METMHEYVYGLGVILVTASFFATLDLGDETYFVSTHYGTA